MKRFASLTKGKLGAAAAWVALTLAAVRAQLTRFMTYDQIKDLVLTLRSPAKIEVLTSPAAPPASAPSSANPIRQAR